MKKAATCLLPAIFMLVSAFTPANAPKTWKAILKLEGMSKTYSFTSDAVYGGFQVENQKIFLFGKNHMFHNREEADAMKVFLDLCTTNAMQQFQFEVNGITSDKAPMKSRNVSGNISFQKKQPVSATFRSIGAGKNKVASIETSGNLKNLGYTFTPEAAKTFTGKYTLTFISSN